MLKQVCILICLFAMVRCAIVKHPSAEVALTEVSHGLYQTENEDVVSSDSASASDSIHYKFISVADTIPAEPGTSFGIEYKITSSSSKDVVLKRVWLFPYPMKDKKGRRYERWENKVKLSVNETHFTYYKFVKHYEILKGKWKLQFYQRDKLVYERAFIVK